MDTETLRQSIHDAFMNTVAPSVFTESERGDDLEIAEKFTGKHWSQVPAATVSYDYDALSYATDEAYCHYLPAYLTALLEESNRAGSMVYSVRSAMSYAEDGGRGAFLNKHKHLRLEQMLVVLLVLEWWAELEKADEYEYKEIKRVLANWQWLVEQIKSTPQYVSPIPEPSFIRTTHSPALERVGENHFRVKFLSTGFYQMTGMLLILGTTLSALFFDKVGCAFLIGPIGILIGAIFVWDGLCKLEKQHRIELKDGYLWIGNPEPLRNIGKVTSVLSVYLTGQEDSEWTDGSSRLYLLIKSGSETEHCYPLFIDTNTTEKIGTAIAKAVNCPFTQAKGKAHLPVSIAAGKTDEATA